MNITKVDTDNLESFIGMLKDLLQFKISYFAKKHNKVIFRNAMWTDKCKINKDKGYIVYYDLDANGYRTATDQIMISVKNEGETIQ